MSRVASWPGVSVVRRLWAAGRTLSMRVSIFLLEPLVALGPVGLVLLVQPEFFALVIALLVGLALARLVRLGRDRVRHRMRARQESAAPPPDQHGVPVE